MLSQEETQPVKVGFLYLLLSINNKMETIIQSIIQLIQAIKNTGRRTILIVIFLLILSASTYILVTNFDTIIGLIKEENKQEIPTYNEYNYNPKQEEITLDIPTVNLLNRFFYTHNLVQELSLINLKEIDINQYSDQTILDSLEFYIQGDHDIEYERMECHDIIAKVERVNEV